MSPELSLPISWINRLSPTAMLEFAANIAAVCLFYRFRPLHTSRQYCENPRSWVLKTCLRGHFRFCMPGTHEHVFSGGKSISLLHPSSQPHKWHGDGGHLWQLLLRKIGPDSSVTVFSGPLSFSASPLSISASSSSVGESPGSTIQQRRARATFRWTITAYLLRWLICAVAGGLWYAARFH